MPTTVPVRLSISAQQQSRVTSQCRSESCRGRVFVRSSSLGLLHADSRIFEIFSGAHLSCSSILSNTSTSSPSLSSQSPPPFMSKTSPSTRFFASFNAPITLLVSTTPVHPSLL
ncbi:hypothetical protein Pcinc_039354 [Petrolisthes cinctipes]|uniref:Uncharacterized protein n=1 Tax=Petrolisthes cinctipes TaxID=88211 RepID=A0AAE1BRS8_PETCI|nr:hypothetical protein Pcinc_039354 [Petrolisthes cinctipes]